MVVVVVGDVVVVMKKDDILQGAKGKGSRGEGSGPLETPKTLSDYNTVFHTTTLHHNCRHSHHVARVGLHYRATLL